MTPIPPHPRDAAHRHTTSGAGCNGRWPGVRRVRPPDETPTADGEVVWSWRRDPGATLAASWPLTTGARKAASPGRARISRKTVARGKPGCLGCTCLTRVHSFSTLAHGAAGAVGARLSLRPLFSRGTPNLQNSGEITPREYHRMFSQIA